MAAYKRLGTGERIKIQSLLDNRESFAKIAEELGVNKTTISREVKTHRFEHDTRSLWFSNRCKHFSDCDKHDLCAGMSHKCRNKACRSCGKVNCNNICKEYSERHCELLSKAPYVCNGCTSRKKCALRKQLYSAEKADRQSKDIRSQSRSGMNLTEEELRTIDKLISPRIRLGQSVHHIFATSQEQLFISEKAAYTLIHSGLISARPIDTPRMVRMSPRKKQHEVKVDKKCRLGRTYDDFLKYMKENPDTPVLEGDTVEGRKGGPCILTLTWTTMDFQIGFFRQNNDSVSVTLTVDVLYETLGYEAFHKVIPPVWLLDNGTEFSNPREIEKYGIKVFYCEPGRPDQKGACENTHSHIRRVLPKGTAFDNFDQGFFDFLFSNINAITRKKLNDHSSYDVFSSMYGNDLDIEQIFHIRRIDPGTVELKPSLVKTYYDSHPSESTNPKEDA